jgi:dsDNA-binding SOS-regulon protein
MHAVTKQEADAYDKMIDAAAELAELIETHGIEMDEYALETLTIFLAGNALEVRKILGRLKFSYL